MTRRFTPTMDRGIRSRDLILKAADTLAGRDGAFNVRTSDVAAEAGVSIGTVYRYFPNMQALLTELGWVAVKASGPYAASFPAIRALLATSNLYPRSDGTVGFGYTRDQLIALLNECTPKLSSISVIPRHDEVHDLTSFEITIFTCFARSELSEVGE